MTILLRILFRQIALERKKQLPDPTVLAHVDGREPGIDRGSLRRIEANKLERQESFAYMRERTRLFGTEALLRLANCLYSLSTFWFKGIFAVDNNVKMLPK